MRSFRRQPRDTEILVAKGFGYPLAIIFFAGFIAIVWNLQADTRSCQKRCEAAGAIDANWVPAQARSHEAAECRCAFEADGATRWRAIQP